MRHGEDRETNSKEGGSLTPWWVEQVRTAASKILAKILTSTPPIQEVTILHTSMKRGEESAAIIKEELAKTLHVKEVKPHPFLKHREAEEILKDVTTETVSDFFLENEPWEQEAHVLISHAYVLKMTAKRRAYIKKDLKWVARVHKYYEHADVTDEYGELLDEKKSDKKT